ncbi:MAG: hypothetical protein RQ754_13165 [Desulfuromonadales bacterium]|nr:hypothetical protein [Desulfuromonadales bacterium]
MNYAVPAVKKPAAKQTSRRVEFLLEQERKLPEATGLVVLHRSPFIKLSAQKSSLHSETLRIASSIKTGTKTTLV